MFTWFMQVEEALEEVLAQGLNDNFSPKI